MLLTLAAGTVLAREVRKHCRACRSRLPVAVSRQLAGLAPPGQRYGYDQIVWVGLAHYQRHLQREEIRAALAQAGLRSSWETIRRQLVGWVRLTTSLRTAAGRWIQCRQDSRPDAKAAELVEAIGLTPGLHRMRTSHGAGATPSPSATQ